MKKKEKITKIFYHILLLQCICLITFSRICEIKHKKKMKWNQQNQPKQKKRYIVGNNFQRFPEFFLWQNLLLKFQRIRSDGFGFKMHMFRLHWICSNGSSHYRSLRRQIPNETRFVSFKRKLHPIDQVCTMCHNLFFS